MQKVGPRKMDCVSGVWGHAPRKFEILHALKCVLEALFRACTQHIYNCKLSSSIIGLRSKNTYGALASGLRCASSISGFRLTNGALASGVRSVSSINAKQKSRLTSVEIQ